MMLKYFSAKLLFASLISAVGIGISVPAQALQIRVAQESAAGAGDFDTNILGFIDSFSTTGTLADFYAYDTNALFGGPSNLTAPNTTNTFFVQGSDGLGFFLVHDRPNNPRSTKGAADMRFELTGGDTASFLVQDDTVDLNDVFDTFAGGTIFTTHNVWDPCCTDGGVIGSIDGSNWEFFAEFTNTPTNITDFLTYSNGSSNIALSLDTGRRVRYDIVPTPAAVLPILSGLFSAAHRKKKRVDSDV